MFKLVQRVDKFLQKHFEVNSTTISIQNGVLAGQSIPHVHVHILPRKNANNENRIWGDKETEQF